MSSSGDLARRVLSSYRAVLRARRVAFQGDKYALEASRREFRKHFDANKNETDAATIEKRLQEASQLATLLRKNVVQAKKIDESRFEARIHDEIERSEMPNRKCKH